jgi:hypothetical protein
MMINSFIKDFNDDIAFKKLVSRKTVKTRYTEKQLKSLSGKVTITNMYDTILHHTAFTMETEDTQKAMLTHWRDSYRNTEILKGMGISSNTLSNHLKRLDIPMKEKGGSRRGSGKSTKLIRKENVSNDTSPSLPPYQEKSDTLTILDGFQLNYNGIYQAEEINKILTKLQLLVDGEENKFRMTISLSEITK